MLPPNKGFQIVCGKWWILNGRTANPHSQGNSYVVGLKGKTMVL